MCDSKDITFNKADMTLINDSDLASIKIALKRYRQDLIDKKIAYRDFIADSQLKATNRMLELLNSDPCFLIVPFTTIDETE